MKTLSLLSILFIAACSSRENPPVARERPSIDITKVIAEELQDKPVVVIKERVPTPPEVVDVDGVKVVLCAKPGLQGYTDSALDETLRGFNARGDAIDECNKRLIKLAKKLKVPIDD